MLQEQLHSRTDDDTLRNVHTIGHLFDAVERLHERAVAVTLRLALQIAQTANVSSDSDVCRTR